MECICGGRTYRTDWITPPSWDGLRCRIWLMETPFGVFQRHEWLHPGENATRIEGWIPSIGRKIPPHFLPVPA